jgi:hypothetical protein
MHISIDAAAAYVPFCSCSFGRGGGLSIGQNPNLGSIYIPAGRSSFVLVVLLFGAGVFLLFAIVTVGSNLLFIAILMWRCTPRSPNFDPKNMRAVIRANNLVAGTPSLPTLSAPVATS